MRKYVQIIDVDGCLCPSIFTNDRLQNDNANCLKPEFLADLAALPMHPWAVQEFLISPHHDTWMRLLITGRLPEMEQLTLDWWGEHVDAGPAPVFISVPWNDKLTTREDSHRDYVVRKARRIADTIQFAVSARPDVHCIVWEDDEDVLEKLDLVVRFEGLDDRVSMRLVRGPQDVTLYLGGE
jgi:hypothetical protein